MRRWCRGAGIKTGLYEILARTIAAQCSLKRSHDAIVFHWSVGQELDHFIILITASSSRNDATFLGKLVGSSHTSVFVKQGSFPLLNVLLKKGFTHFSGRHLTTTSLLNHARAESSVTVKRAHRRSTFSGFFGPPFLFSFTINFSLQEPRHGTISCPHPHCGQKPERVGVCVVCMRVRDCCTLPPLPAFLHSPDLFGLASVVQGEEDICILADAVVSEALQVDEEVVRHGDTAAVTVPLSRAVTLGTGENSDR